MNTKRLIKRIAGYTASAAVLLSGVSAYALHELEKINAREFANSEVIIKNKKIPIQEFYENVTNKNGTWYYTERQGKKKINYNIASFCDIDGQNRESARQWEKMQKVRHTRVDTVYYIRLKNDSWAYTYKKTDRAGNLDTIPNRPARGISGHRVMVIRQFEPLDGNRDMRQEIHNDKYNCTSEHEDQHFQNKRAGEDMQHPAGVGQIGQSYELTYVEACLDEISANIRQLIAQRRNYLNQGKDTTYITPQYAFYAEALRNGTINPETPDKISKEERRFIVNGIFDYWMEKRYDLYAKRNTDRTIITHDVGKSNYNSVIEDTIRHRRVVKHMFLIDGYDFSEVIHKREHEILEKIAPWQKFYFAIKANKKKAEAQGKHLDELEYIRITEGEEAFSEKIEKNIKLAKLNKKVANIKKSLGLSR